MVSTGVSTLTMGFSSRQQAQHNPVKGIRDRLPILPDYLGLKPLPFNQCRRRDVPDVAEPECHQSVDIFFFYL